MTMGRWAVLAGVVGVGLLAGCGGTEQCGETPEINDAPTSCTLAPNTDVTVKVRWCNCGAAVTCDVEFDSGSYLLTPRLSSCDESCPANPSDCGLDSDISCRFTTQDSGTYPVNIVNGLGVREAVFNVNGGGGTSCGP